MSVFRAVNVGLHSTWLDPFFFLLSYFGLGQITGLACLGFAFNRSTRYFALPLILADAIAGFGVADTLKGLIYRDRPSNLAFAFAEEPHRISSFPSGHSTTAFAVSTMLVFLTWNTEWKRWGQASLSLAALIAFSRIYRGMHWPTDVVAGACIGVATSCLLFFILPKFGISISGPPAPKSVGASDD